MRRNKKIWKKVMAAVLLMIMCLQMVIPSRAENEEIIFIRTAADLVELSEKCKSDSWSIGKVVVLENDISLKEVEYSPIPYFAGTFNGQGYTISDLEGNGRFYPAGLFGIVAKEGIVQNLEVTGALLPEGENGCVGGIAGDNRGVIKNCSFSGVVSGEDAVGGIVGINREQGLVSECSFQGTIRGEKQVGGIVGENLGTISECINSGYVNNTSEKTEITLDVVGMDMLLDVQTVNSSDIANAPTNIGGIAGYSSGFINDCSNNKTVGYPKVGYNIGGIAGWNNGYICECNNKGSVYGRKDVGGIVGQAEPYVAVEISKSKPAILERQVLGLENQMDSLSACMGDLYESVEESKDVISPHFSDVRAKVTELKNLLSKQNGQLTEDGKLLEDILKKVDKKLENVDVEATGIEESLGGLEHVLDKIEQETSVEATEVRKSMSKVREILDELAGVLEKISELEILKEEETFPDSGETDELPDIGDMSDIADMFNQEGLEELESCLKEILVLMGELSEESEVMLQSLEEYIEFVNENSGYAFEYTDKLEYHAEKIAEYAKDIKGYLDELEMFDKIDNLQNFQADATKLMDELSESMENIDKELENMDGNVSGLTGQIHDDVKDIQNQLKLISNTGKDILSESEGEVITEISKEDIAEATYGKIEKSTNYALIEGDLNVGGITGIMSVEYETNPEEELSSEISWREQKSFELKTVLFECTNKGEITANKDAAGGICGWMDVGIISSCYSYGPVTSVSGGYVGGIAGITRSTITDCIANNRLSGKCYVGGIAGSGFESSEGNSKINNNYSMVEIIDCQQFEGAIAGKDLGEFEFNYFVSDKLAGINRVDYLGKAEKITYAELLERKNLVNELQTFTLSFVADDLVIGTRNFNYGDNFKKEQFPEVPQKDGYSGSWDVTELKNLCVDTVVNAVYTPCITALRTEVERKNGRPVFILEGEFDEDDSFSAVLQSQEEIGQRYRHFGEIRECWKLSFDSDGKKRHSVRYLGEKENLKLYIKEGNEWIKAETTEFGSYDAFTISGTEAEVMVVEGIMGWLVWGTIAIGIVSVIALMVFVQKKTKIFSKITTRLGMLMKKKTTLLTLIACAVLTIIGIILYFAKQPQVQIATEIASLSSDFLVDKDKSMKVQMTADVGQNHIELDAKAAMVKLHEKNILVIEENEHAIYLCGENLFLENGKGFCLEENKSGKNSLLEQIVELYKATDIVKAAEGEEVIYSITAEGEKTKELLEVFITSMEGQLSSEGKVQIDMIAADGNLEAVKVYGEGKLKDAMETPIKVSAVITDVKEINDVEQWLPEEVKNAILNGESSSYQVIGEEMYRLLLAWAEFLGEEQTGLVALDVSCGPLVLETEYDWANILGGRAKAENGVYLKEIPDLVYEICMNGDFTYETVDRKYTFYISLDEKDMQKLSQMIAPQIVNQAVSLTDGTMEIVVDNNKIVGFEIEIMGDVTVLLSRLEASIGAKFSFE